MGALITVTGAISNQEEKRAKLQSDYGKRWLLQNIALEYTKGGEISGSAVSNSTSFK